MALVNEVAPESERSSPANGEDELHARAQSRLGETLGGKYRLDRVLGVGGMGAVYAAMHRNGRPVAVKLLHAEYAMRTEIKKRFLREGRVANAIDHPGVLTILDDEVAEDGTPFLVMELLEGASLEEVWKRNDYRIPLPLVLGIGVELLDVLVAAHKHAVIHRDIKPANLFLTTAGKLKVLDFGIARILDVTTEATRTGTMMGTPRFMPPEQALGHKADARTDLWAAGATLLTLATGHFVHEARTPAEQLIKAATTQARAFASLFRDAPPDVARVIDRALAFNAADRWPTAMDMREALFLAGREAFGRDPDTEGLTALLPDLENTDMEARGPGAVEAPTMASGSNPAIRVGPPAIVSGHDVPPSLPASTHRVEITVSPREGRPWGLMAAALVVAGGTVLAFSFKHRAPPREPVFEASPAAVPTPTASEAPPPPVSASASATPLPPADPKAKKTRSPTTKPTRTTAGCNPPYDLDGQGNKIWKRECF